MNRTLRLFFSLVLIPGLISASQAGPAYSQNQLPFFSDFAADVSPQSGAATLAIPINVPQGRGGIQPNITLQYNSKLPNGPLGVGWTLELSAIQITNKEGVPNYDSSDTYSIMQAGSTSELVWDGAANQYRTKTEGAFSRIVKNGSAWEITERTGTKYYFGTTEASRERDPGATGRIYKWCLDKVVDVHGNEMTYQYERSSERLYPLQILYTGHTGLAPYAQADFFYESRNDSTSTHLSGFHQKYLQRLSKIAVSVNTSAGNEVQREYTFDYAYSARTGRSILKTITEYGDDGTPKPALMLTYDDLNEPVYQTEINFNEIGAGDNLWEVKYHQIGTCSTQYCNGPTIPHCYGNYDQGRINSCFPWTYKQTASSYSDSLIDFSVQADGDLTISAPAGVAFVATTYLYKESAGQLIFYNTSGSHYEIFVNGINAPGTFNLNQGWNRVEIVNDSRNDATSFNQNSGMAGQSDAMNSTFGLVPQVIADFNSDGRADLGDYDESAGVFSVSLSEGHGFGVPETWISNLPANEKILTGDFDRDGWTDLVAFDSTNGNWRVATNQGNGTFLLEANDFKQNFGHGSLAQRVADMNGDGYSDLVVFTKIENYIDIDIFYNQAGGSIPSYNYEHYIAGHMVHVPFIGDFNGDGLLDYGYTRVDDGHWYFFLNNGSGFYEFLTYSSFWVGRTPLMADFDADGLTDMGYYDHSAGRIRYKRSLGLSFGSEEELEHTFSVTVPSSQVIPADFNGDGLPDYSATDGGSNVEYAYAVGQLPDLLKLIDNSVGGVSNIAYTSSTDYPHNFLPFSTPVVFSVTTSNSLGSTYTTVYDYANGLWDADTRDFRGFGMVKVIDPDGNYAETVFHQDALKAGRVDEQATYDKDGVLFAKTDYTWNSQTIGPAEFVFLERKDNYVYDGQTTPRQTAETFTYGSFGNLTQTVQLGDVSVTGDERTVETTYVNNTDTSVWILGLPSETVVKDDAGAPVRKTWFDYDGQSNGVAPAKGLLTRKTDWGGGAPDPDPVTLYEYDVYGNLTETTDPRGNETAITYDTDYQLFPLATQNALTHNVVNEYYGVNGVATSDAEGYHGLWGRLKSTTDPNQKTGRRNYDMFGRLKDTVSPMDTLQLSTGQTDYVFDDVFALVTSRRRKVSGQSGEVVSFDCYDGLGRLILNKTPSGRAEDDYVISGQTIYNTRGLPIMKFLPYFAQGEISLSELLLQGKPFTATGYDAMGRVKQVTNPDGTYSTIDYDRWSTTTVDENGRMQQSDFDAYGRLIEKREYTGADGRSTHYAATSGPVDTHYTLYAQTQYQYDSEGNLTRTIAAANDPNLTNITTITYDKLGRKTSMTDPDMGEWFYEYDLNGNLVKQTDAKGQSIEFEYDVLNRLKRKFSGTVLDVTYTYDDDAMTHAKGRLTTAGYDTGAADFNYDELGRETLSTKTIDLSGFDVGRGYDALNNLIKLTYPNAEEVHYQYNAAGQVIAIATEAGLLPAPPASSGSAPPLPDVMEAPFIHFTFNDNAANTTVQNTGTSLINGFASRNTGALSMPGKIGNSFDFDKAQNDKVNVSGLVNAIKSDQIGSIALWVKKDVTGTQMHVFAVDDADGSAEFRIAVMPFSSQVSMGFDVDYGVQKWYAINSGAVVQDQWVHLVLVQDGIEAKLYVNGTQVPFEWVNIGNKGAWFNVYAGWDSAWFGCGAYNGGTNQSCTDGSIDDFRYYKHPLQQAEVDALYNGGAGTEAARPVLAP